MKKVLALSTIVLTLALAGCSGKSIQNENKAVETSKPIITESTQNQVAESAIDEAGIKIQYPGDYSLSKSTEPDRRGSFVSYDFQTKGSFPTLSEIQFFSRESIKNFDHTCIMAPCFEGDYPTVERYDQQKLALGNKQKLDNYSFQSYNDRNYYVTNLPCNGDFCTIRQYTTFIKDTEIDIWIMMGDNSQAAQADQLFSNLKIIEQQ